MNDVATPRRRARAMLVRALYQAEVNADALASAWAEVGAEDRLPSEAQTYADALAGVLQERASEIDATIRRALEHWSFERLGATDRGVLRLGTAELLAMRGTPARVVLDEAVTLARTYGREESGPFVNGVLDRVARQLRPGELEESAELPGRPQ